MEDLSIPELTSSATVSAINPVIIEPFRFIEPYPFTFHCTAKKRWFGRQLVEVFVQEFKHWPRETIIDRIEHGKILVNGKRIFTDYRIKEHDIIDHSIIRRECPVYNKPIIKLGETTDYVAFLKPASVPIHATGGYFYQALVKRVGERYFPVHRLDRVTGGIIVMGKSEDAARKFAKLLEGHTIRKTYVARVQGQFPPENIIVNEPIKESADRSRREISPDGKPSETHFKLLWTDGEQSVVECHPITGRTHQIRVHLAFLGYPIANDELYGGKFTEMTKQEQKALNEATRRGLYPPDTVIDHDDPDMIFQIYLHSIKYESDEFCFEAPLPEWAVDPSSQKKSDFFSTYCEVL